MVTRKQMRSLTARFKEQFIPMIRELKKYEKRRKFLISFMGNQSIVRDAFKTPRKFSPYWWIEEASPYCAAIGDIPGGEFLTTWLEFQPIKDGKKKARTTKK